MLTKKFLSGSQAPALGSVQTHQDPYFYTFFEWDLESNGDLLVGSIHFLSGTSKAMGIFWSKDLDGFEHFNLETSNVCKNIINDFASYLFECMVWLGNLQ